MRKTSLGIVDNYELVKRRVITNFNLSYKRGHDKEEAYKRASVLLNKSIKQLNLSDRRAISGLRAELLFYYSEFDKLRLKPIMASGDKSDFAGMIRGHSAAIDVTTNPFYKETETAFPIRTRSEGWKYYLGVVDLKERNEEVYPLLLPRCEDGSVGHFVLVILGAFHSESLRLTGQSDYQAVVRYNCSAQTDDEAVEEVVAEYNYVTSEPSHLHREVMHDAHTPEIYSSPADARNDFLDRMKSEAFEFRKLTGFVLSAVVGLDWEWFTKDDGEWVTRLYWVHPHVYIRTRLGKPLDSLDYNVAAVVHEY